MAGELPLVSVVTPVYNGGAYIEECMTSVLRQTYEHWVHTVVDNRSTDATPELVERFASRDSRITLLRFEEFVGAIENHNRAFGTVDSASAYCKMVQADDWIYPTCIERMVEAASRSDSIGIVSAYQRRGDAVHLVGVPYDDTVFSGRTILRQSLTGGPNVTGGPTAVLIRSDLIRGSETFWDESLVHADTEAAYRILARHDLGFVHEVLTYARRQPGSRRHWSERIVTGMAEDVLFLVRYGPLVLDDGEYRKVIRRELMRLVRFHMTQTARLSRMREPEFFTFHSDVVSAIRREADGDRDVERALSLVDLLLRRGVVAERLARGSSGTRSAG